MRHELPADVKGREKIIGGLLDIVQGMWLIGFLILGVGVFLIFYPVLNLFAVIFGLPIALMGIPLAFYKKEELTLFNYLLLKYQFKHKQKILIKDRRF